MSIASILGPDGIIARQLAQYEPRSQQLHMADAVAGCLKNSEQCFMVVGAAHLVGQNGVVRLLEKKGYKVEQVLANSAASE